MEKIEFFEKLSKIVFAGAGAFILGIAGWQINSSKIIIERAEFNRGNAQFCFSNIENIAALRTIFEEPVFVPPFLREKFRLGCGLPIEKEDEADYFINSVLFPATGPSSGTPLDQIASAGYAAIGRVDPSSYGEVNFDLIDTQSLTPSITTNSAPKRGDILLARWSVNIRKNTEITTGHSNPPVGLISEGQCVKLTEDPRSLRGQYWAEVATEECPEMN